MAPHADQLTLAEAADRLGVHYMTAYRYVRTGRLPASRVGRSWVVLAADLPAVAEASMRRGDAAGGDPSSRVPIDAAARLEARLVVGDESGAWMVVEESLTAGLEPSDALLGLLVPAMVAVGEDWHRGRVTVAQEHRATALAMRLVSRLGPRFARPGLTRGVVVLGSPPGDHHSMPSAILRDLLRGHRIEAVDLGANVPVASWAEVVADLATEEGRLLAVGIAATTPGNEDAIAAAIGAIRAVSDVPVLLGGSAVGRAAVARRLGATHHSRSATDAVEQIEALAAGE